MIRVFLGALLSAVLIVCYAASEPTLDKVQASARWSVQLQAPLQALMTDMNQIDDYAEVLDQFERGTLSKAKVNGMVDSITRRLNQSLDTYAAALDVMPPHPASDLPIGAAMTQVRLQMIAQIEPLREFIGRIDTLSRNAIRGDAAATDQLSGEIYRSAVLLLETDIVLLRTQLAALPDDNPLHSLNTASIAQTQLTQELMLAQASHQFGSSPDFPDGDLDGASARLADARQAVATGRSNAWNMIAMLEAQRRLLNSPDPLYDRVIEAMKTFSSDWVVMDRTLSEADQLISQMQANPDGTEQALEAYLTNASSMNDQMIANQLTRSRLIGG